MNNMGQDRALSPSAIMRRVLVALSTIACLLMVSVAFAAASGVPEIDRANATLSLTAQHTFGPTQCGGEDAINYTTYTGTWTGTQTETTPGFTDFSLSGSITVANIKWTINQTTGRGVLIGSITLTSDARAKTYSGKLVLLTQGEPAAGTVVAARGWINASTFVNNTADGGTLLANTEFQINGGTFAASAKFGDASGTFGYPNFSVITKNQTC